MGSADPPLDVARARLGRALADVQRPLLAEHADSGARRWRARHVSDGLAWHRRRAGLALRDFPARSGISALFLANHDVKRRVAAAAARLELFAHAFQRPVELL